MKETFIFSPYNKCRLQLVNSLVPISRNSQLYYRYSKSLVVNPDYGIQFYLHFQRILTCEEITSANTLDESVNNKSPKVTCYELLWLSNEN